MTIETLQGYAEVEARIHGRDVRTKIIMSKKKQQPSKGTGHAKLG